MDKLEQGRKTGLEEAEQDGDALRNPLEISDLLAALGLYSLRRNKTPSEIEEARTAAREAFSGISPETNTHKLGHDLDDK